MSVVNITYFKKNEELGGAGERFLHSKRPAY
jgi:hypothetical protein